MANGCISARAGGSSGTCFTPATCSRSTAPWASVTCAIPPPAGILRPKRSPSTSILPYGITLAHNGNLVSADALKLEIYRDDLRHVNTDSDSEILLNVFAHELQRRGRLRLDEEDVFAAVSGVHARCVGGYAVVGMINGYGVFAFRDPHAIRPVCLGARERDGGMEYMVASESAGLDVLGFDLMRDLEPGEAVYIDALGNVFRRQCAEDPVHVPCIFEYVYLARPDSIIDDVSVYKARLRLGEHLADKILGEWPSHDIDVVIPIPDTSRTACLPVQYKLGIKHREGFIKNRYIGRTFIMPGQEQRERSVRRKLNPIGLEFEGKNVLLVDDSIVRGTTSAQIIQMARDAGAKKVYFASAAPPVRYQNVYGIDMPGHERAGGAQAKRGGSCRANRGGSPQLPGPRRPGRCGAQGQSPDQPLRDFHL